ncbi:MAG TPA: carbamoyltransferase C-terminal domain-containing protein [Ktedonobacteraceae bacterium]
MPAGFPTIIHSHATTWHDGAVAVLLEDGSIYSLAAERVGDRYKHSWNSKLAYEYLSLHFADNPLYDITSERNHFKDAVSGLEDSGHHLYHAASAYFGSPFQHAAILVIDGQGPEQGKKASTTIWQGEGEELRLLEAPYLADGAFAAQSIGHFYTAIGALAGMQQLHEEGKTMGLAPYGKPSRFLDCFRKYAYSNVDGSYYIEPRFIYAILEHTFGATYFGWSPQAANQAIWDELLSLRGKPPRQAGEQVSQEDMDIAYAGQIILEEITLGLAKRAQELTGEEFLCLAGGVALNSVANGKIVTSELFKDIFIFPAAGDDGQAIGKLFYDIHKSKLQINTITETAYYGPLYSREAVLNAILKYGDQLVITEQAHNDFVDNTVDRILSGQVVGWFRGRSELGPRALGHRSIFADPRREGMRDYINASIKGREWYRPLAPIVLEEEVHNYFDLHRASPFMLLVAPVKTDKRDLIPAIVHIDGSARIQTINIRQDATVYTLVQRFGQRTGIPLLLNTSFNRQGEPIVESPEDALKAFLTMNLDALILDDIIVEKRAQV